MMKKCLSVMMSIGLMASGAIAQSADGEPEAGAKIGGDAAVATAGDEVAPKDVAKLLGEQLIIAEGDGVKAAKLDTGMEYYLVYHSASWCGSCKGVTSQLAKINQKNLALAADERKFSLIMVGHDDTEEGVADYLKASGLGCAAVKTPIGKLVYGEPVTTLLTTGYTGTIPALLLLDKDGQLVTRDLREVLLKTNSLSRGKSKRVKEREARAAAKAAAAEAAGKE